MAASKFTGDGQQKIVAQLMCSPTAGLHGQLTFISVLNSFLPVNALLGNALILIALHKESSLHSPSKLLLRCLATTDLCAGLIVEPLAVIGWMSVVNEHWNICPYVYEATSITATFLWSICVDTDCNKCGQTSRPVVGTKIQTSCNFKTNLRDRYYLLDCVHCHFSNAILESPDNLLVWHHGYTTVSYYLDLLLHKDFPHPPSSSKSCRRPCSTTEPNKSTEHGAIQKGIIYCNMAATDAGRLLYSLWCSDGFGNCWKTIFTSLSRLDLLIHFSFYKLVIKPDSLLLEDRRSQTSSEGHNQTSALPLFFDLDRMDLQYMMEK